MTTTASAAHDTRARHTPTCQRCWLLRWPGRPLCAPEQRAKSAALAAGRQRCRWPRQACMAAGSRTVLRLPRGAGARAALRRRGRAAVSVRGLPRRAAGSLLLPLFEYRKCLRVCLDHFVFYIFRSEFLIFEVLNVN